MNLHEVRILVLLLAVNILGLWVAALVASGLFFTPRLPLLTRILLLAGSVVFTATTAFLWRRTRFRKGSR